MEWFAAALHSIKKKNTCKNHVSELPCPHCSMNEAAGQLRGLFSLPERERCRFSALCQEGQGAIWNRELQGLAGTAWHRAMKVLLSPSIGKDAN